MSIQFSMWRQFLEARGKMNDKPGPQIRVCSAGCRADDAEACRNHQSRLYSRDLTADMTDSLSPRLCAK